MDINHAQTERGGHFYAGDAAAPGAELVYRLAGEHKMIIDHTEVSEKFEGHGLGKQLVAAAVDYARQHQLKIFPLCPFAKSVMEKTPAYADVLITALH